MKKQSDGRDQILAERIYDVIIEKGAPMSLKEISTIITDKPKTTIRGRIYDNLKKLFKRIGRGIYWVIDPEKKSEVFVVEGCGRNLTELDDESVDAIITDHPWEDPKSNSGSNRKFVSSYEDATFQYQLGDFAEKARVLRTGGFLVEVLPAENENNYKYLYQIKVMAEECGLFYYAKVPWKKGVLIANTGRKAKNTEDIMFFTKGKARNLRPDVQRSRLKGFPCFMSGAKQILPTEFNFQPKNLRERIHQAEKPVELFEAILELVTEPGELVVDQFAGSGNLGKAALRTGRCALLFEVLRENVRKIIGNIGAVELQFSST